MTNTTRRPLRRLAATLLAAATVAIGLSACSSDADVVEKNLSKDADNFKILRRIVFYNGITDTYLLELEGYCSVDATDASNLRVVCKTGPNEYKKHFLGRSDNVTWFAEQVDGANVSASHYKVVFKPSVIVPDVEKR